MFKATILRGRYVLRFGVCTLLFFTLSVAVGHAETIMIDSFDFPDLSDLLFCPGDAPWGDGNPCAMERSFADILGGERDVFVETLGEPLTISASAMAGSESAFEPGLLVFATYGFGSVASASYLTLQYDGEDDDADEPIWPTLTNSGQLNADLTGGGTNNAFVFSFLGLDAGNDRTSLDLKITVNGSNGSSAVHTGTIPESSIAFDHTVDFADFTITGVDPFNAATSVTFTFNDPIAPVRNVDFELDSVSAVPEPSTLGLLAFGCLGCLIGVRAWRPRRR